MISVEQALQLVAAEAQLFATEEVALLRSNGRVLAQDVVADRDMPPFDRATMDGIAIDSSVFQGNGQQFLIEDIQPAGHPQKQLQDPINAIEVMTGAMLPQGTDAVIRYEDIAITDDEATVHLDEVKPKQNVHLQGADEKAGEVLVRSGNRITPAIIGTMASVGLASVRVYRLPRVAVCSTGDELVDVGQVTEAHQIRRSNSYMLLAALQQEGITANAYHLPDEPGAITQQISAMLVDYEVLLFSGAVSKGKFDHLPGVLANLGMQTIFHNIAQKPGKPLLFGKMPQGTIVFGFPGNPVSTWVCYQLYFRHWLNRSQGLDTAKLQAVLSRPLTFKPALTHHVLVKLNKEQGLVKAIPVSTSTSGDMVNLMQGQGLISLPANEEYFEESRVFDVLTF